MQLVIIAGGKGTRLGLKDIPKPMVKIAGKPLLEHQILFAKRYGINEIFIFQHFVQKFLRCVLILHSPMRIPRIRIVTILATKRTTLKERHKTNSGTVYGPETL